MSFSSLIAIARNSRTMLNNSGERGHPCLVPDLGRNAFIFFFTIENNLCCGYVIYGLYYVEIGSFDTHFQERFFFFFLSWIGAKYCWKFFLHLLRWSYDLPLLRVPWTARRSNLSVLKEISPEYSLERLMLKLKLQYFGLQMQTTDLLEKTDVGKDWRQKEMRAAEDEMAGWHHWLNRQEFEQALGDSEGQGSLECCSPWGYKELDMI